MDFELPEELRLLKEQLRRFVDTEIIPIERDAYEGDMLKADVRERLEARVKELGLWMFSVPQEYGGQGLGLLARTIIYEEMGRTIAIPYRKPNIFGPEPNGALYEASDYIKEKFLWPVLRGEKRMCFMQTEPDAGSDPGGMRTTAVRDGNHYVINGYKRFISHAKGSDFLQLVAATDPEKGSRGGLSVFIVDMDSKGLSIVRENHHMMGDVTYEIALDDVKVPAENLVGEEGQGMREAQSWISRNRVHQATHGLGVTQRCLEMIGKYAQERVTFGEPLAKRQAVQFAVADLYTKYQVGQLLTHRTAWKVDKGIASRHDAYMCKIFCTELGLEAADRCIQFHGAMGLTTEMPIEAMWRRSRSYLITGGPAEVMRATLAREVFKIYQ